MEAFRILPLSGRVFGFSLWCKEVCFVVYRLRSSECRSFISYFHLWNSGDPNWSTNYICSMRRNQSLGTWFLGIIMVHSPMLMLFEGQLF